MKRLIVLGLMSSCLIGCTSWPSIIIGDSSGSLQYDRNARVLTVVWDRHTIVLDSASASKVQTNGEQSENCIKDSICY